MCANCADCLIGTKSANRSGRAWKQVYRAISHGPAKNACKNNAKMKEFPKEIEDFANAFVTMQVKRHSADYDPDYRVARSEVQVDVDAAKVAIKQFKKAPIKDRRAFAAWVVLITRE